MVDALGWYLVQVRVVVVAGVALHLVSVSVAPVVVSQRIGISLSNMMLRLSSSVCVPFLPVAKISQIRGLLRRLERVVARRRCCSFLFLRRVVPSVVQVILRARRVVEPAWGGFGAVFVGCWCGVI